MKALLINGSPRPNGCTFTALTELANTLEAEGIETEIVHIPPSLLQGKPGRKRPGFPISLIFAR